MASTEITTKEAEFDTALAALHAVRDGILRRIKSAEDEARRAAGDKRDYHGRRPVWRMLLADALDKAPAAAARHGALLEELSAVRAEIAAMDRAYTGWSRFFPTETSSGGHIHSSTGCHTLQAATVIRWTPALSGRSVEEAVASLGPLLCQACFPEARAEHKRDPREYAREKNAGARAAKQAERAAAAALKQLTGDEQFRAVHSNDQVTTVAACKQLIRDAVDCRAHLERYRTMAPNPAEPAAAESVARYAENLARRLAGHEQDAARAEAVLLAREAGHEGYGATAEGIAKIKDSAARRAARDWAA